mmetsp:Transcript_67854/g.119773  ORF Transcript_67854/g.119773 Transcript_67854/m.119773 type:complete len:274 (+) Transcript_67854:767-1588(+)
MTLVPQQMLSFLRRKCNSCKGLGPVPSRTSPRRTLMEVTTLQLQRMPQVSCMVMATPMCCSSRPRQLKHSSGPRPKMQCPTLWAGRQLRADMLRTPVLLSMVVRAGQMLNSTTTRPSALETLPSPWATTTLPAPKPVARPKWSTLSATKRTRMERHASFSTTRQCLTTLLLLQRKFPRRRWTRHKRLGPALSRPSPRPIWMEVTTLQQLVRLQVSYMVMAIRRYFSSRPRHLRHSSGPRQKMPCLTSLGMKLSKVAILRTLASPSTGARAGQM